MKELNVKLRVNMLILEIESALNISDSKLHKVIAIGEIIYFIYPFRAKKRPDSASHEAESG